MTLTTSKFCQLSSTACWKKQLADPEASQHQRETQKSGFSNSNLSPDGFVEQLGPQKACPATQVVSV